jgi:hypothetical protein
MRQGDRVTLEVHNSKTNLSDWLPGAITGFACSEGNETEDRVNVKLDDGRHFMSCHPDCVKPA